MPTPSRRELANAIRFLAADAVEQAKSGHPGMPMGMATSPKCCGTTSCATTRRTRSGSTATASCCPNGHGSMLQYALLHLSGYDLPIEELKNFRQLHSKTGRPPGSERDARRGDHHRPAGPGARQRRSASRSRRSCWRSASTAPDFAGRRPHHLGLPRRRLPDGGISHEACSLAGTWGLGKLIALWDDNSISIDGNVAGWFTDDTAARFEAYGWQVIRAVDGHDHVEIAQAIKTAQAETTKAHADLLPHADRLRRADQGRQGIGARRAAGQGRARRDARKAGLEARALPRGRRRLPMAGAPATPALRARKNGAGCSIAMRAPHPELAAELLRRSQGELPAGFRAHADAYAAKLQGRRPGGRLAQGPRRWRSRPTRPALPELIGGSADLAHSNLTLWSGSRSVAGTDPAANYVYYGVREFGMSAISNGWRCTAASCPTTPPSWCSPTTRATRCACRR
jgi:transketolase